MKLTKKLEAEILKAYHGFWDANIRGDMKAFASYMDDSLIGYGTAKAEVFTSKKEAVKFYSATADQMTGKADFRNRKINVKTIGNTVVVNEQCDLYVLAGKAWMFYGHARVTSIFEQKGNSWKIVHHHASFPDSRAEEGEQIATKKIKKENLQLREAVKRRTVELEEKNRELEIETALEKVRAIAMGMKERSDMLKICKAISLQLAKLGVKDIRNVQTAVIYREKGTYTNYEFYAKHNKLLTTEVSYTNHPMSKAFVKKMLNGPNEFFKKSLKGSKVQDWYAFQKKATNQFADTYLRKATSLNYYWYSLGPVALGISTYEPLSNEAQELFVRFRNVFELAYRRFLDIEKAEAQAREAQIELSLERVRARTMAMQKSEELNELIKILYSELTRLELSLDRCFIMTFDPQTHDATWWMASGDDISYKTGLTVPYHTHPPQLAYIKGWKEEKERWNYVLEGKEKRDWDKFLFSKTDLSKLPGAVIAGMKNFKKAFISASFKSFGCLTTGSHKPLTDEAFDILIRFTKVFDQSYIRFLDLKKAEAQAREAQIEATLEKVRSRSLAMHHSDELEQVAASLFDRLTELGLSFDGALIFIFEKERRNIRLWVATNQLSAPVKIELPYDEEIKNNAIIKDLWNAIENSNHIFNKSYSGETKNDYFRYVQKYNESTIPEAVKQIQLENESWTACFAAEKNSVVGFDSWSGHIMKEEDFQISIRFARVFEQAYTRFLDLQKAEAQAREAQIEAALERVRSRTMGMQKSEELKEVIQIVYEQFVLLNINTEHTGFILDYKTRDDFHSWIADKFGTPSQVTIPYFDCIYYNRFNEAKEKGIDFFTTTLSLEDKNRFYQDLFKYVPGFPEESKKIIFNHPGFTISTVLLEDVALYIENFTGVPYSEEDNAILMRFGKIFQQTYTRFLDLQKAEHQAREARVEASLERVRTQAMAMHKSDDLLNISKVLYEELKMLGIDEIRNAMLLIHDEKNDFFIDHDYSSIGGKITRIPTNGISLIEKYVKELKENEKSKVGFLELIVSGEELESWKKARKATGQLDDPRLDSIEVLYYYHYSIGKGNISISTFSTLSNQKLQVLERFRNVFQLPYQRYHDIEVAVAQSEQARLNLIQIQTEKKRAEDALAILKATQTQLVQSEKLASLGELTAGIAHEIQNPLNFVNNFSDVSNELIDEMKEELAKGNIDDAMAIAEDVKQNLEKINHHGKRADGIVKGMLQHSRSSSGQKEITDINILADEYLRLAYHGLRAKDKSFNAKFETDFDDTIDKINIIPQDIGRVILNLINNAFYAVTEKKKQYIEARLPDGQGYEPTVTVSTSKLNGFVEIRVKDNGIGIPQKVLDKIFQPFFTTKPTGQGTGLGLSLAYDIIKAHRGELKVETKEGEGSEFIIQLPAAG